MGFPGVRGGPIRFRRPVDVAAAGGDWRGNRFQVRPVEGRNPNVEDLNPSTPGGSPPRRGGRPVDVAARI